MDSSKLYSYIEIFSNKAINDKLIVFVGAGVSCNVNGFSSWNSLIEEMATSINYNKCDYCKSKTDNCTLTCTLKSSFSTDEFLKIPQYVFNKDKKLYNSVLTKKILKSNVDAPLSSAIFDINPSHIITTNYDNLLETSSNELRKQYDVIIHDKDLLEANNKKYIIKMHGDINDFNTIVLKEQDYLDYSQKHVLIELFVKSLLTDHTIMFLGYSLNDYNIKLMISWINYIRTQNKDVLKKKTKLGYVVLDEESISELQIKYLENNNIGVVNINDIPIYKTIPTSLTDDRGKRLYTFLQSISNTSVRNSIFLKSHYVNTIKLLITCNYVNHQTILKSLNISNYSKNGSTITLYSKEDFDNISVFFNSKSNYVKSLRKLFLDSGVTEIIHSENFKRRNIEIGTELYPRLRDNDLFNLYLSNNYLEILKRIKAKNSRLSKFEKLFYNVIINDYSDIFGKFNDINTKQLTINETVQYLHNKSVLEAIKGFSFDSKRPVFYIDNIVSDNEKMLYQDYIQMYDGNSSLLHKMETHFNKLEKDIGTNFLIGSNVGELYKMKELILDKYCFYFYNYLYFVGFNEIPNLVYPYIKGIVMSNGYKSKKNTSSNLTINHVKKYDIDSFDFDMMSKFITTKDLNDLIVNNKIDYFYTNEKSIDRVIVCYQNICKYIEKTGHCGYNNSIYRTFFNLSLIITKLRLNDNHKKNIAESLLALFKNELFVKFVFSFRYPNFRSCIKILCDLCKQLKFKSNIDLVFLIIENFTKDYIVNTNIYNIKSLFSGFLNYKDLKPIQKRIETFIYSYDELNFKIYIIRLFKDKIIDGEFKDQLREYVLSNLENIDTDALFDFLFSKWITPTENDIHFLFDKVIYLLQKKNGITTYPNNLDIYLDCIFILYMEGYIKDLSELSKFASSNVILDFLINPDDFDYKKIDFSYYMWENFARREKYRNYFIKHKNEIVPQIQDKIKIGAASEFEKKMLYGFLLESNEIL